MDTIALPSSIHLCQAIWVICAFTNDKVEAAGWYLWHLARGDHKMAIHIRIQGRQACHYAFYSNLIRLSNAIYTII